MRERVRVYGIVQGVGFRPFVDRIATREGICGTVSNKGPYVEIFAEGTYGQLEAFVRALTKEAPPRAAILKMDRMRVESDELWEAEAATAAGIDADGRFFRIIESAKTRGAIYVSPDIAICDQCKRELFDQSNRRYLHPFINCTACGPRLTILVAMPYDRERTSMRDFPMCPECAHEYSDPTSRRYDAQPVCCNKCGPRVATLPEIDGGPKLYDGAAIVFVRDVIRAGGIAALKGIGGFHLCCDATNEAAVSRLRRLKDRPFKPFAVMLRDIKTVERECFVTPGQRVVLDGPQKPILLLRRRTREWPQAGPAGGAVGVAGPQPRIASSVAPDNPNIGVMLPYAPMQLLIFSFPDGRSISDCLVMTSANPKGAPICRDDADVVENLKHMCDVALTHDRTILLRADDTVMSWYEDRPYMIRRSRGYSPLPVGAGDSYDDVACVLAIGGELKSSFCITSGELMYMSPYVGDLADVRSVEALRQAICRMEELLEAQPALVVCDKHPLYNSRALAHEIARKTSVPVVEIQHHFAHVLSCMAENECEGPVIGVAFDGTGYGEDGTIWGGEWLLADVRGFQRMGHIATFAQAGGDLAARQGWRIASALLLDACESWQAARELAVAAGICSGSEFDLVRAMISSGINTVASSSCGRLFDAAAAAIGVRRVSTCEGEAAMVLEFAAERYARRQAQAHIPDRAQTARGESSEPETCGSDESGSSDVLVVTCESDGFAKSDERQFPDLVFESGADGFTLSAEGLIRKLAICHTQGAETDYLAWEFHRAMARAVICGCKACRRESGVNVVALSGGVMQNILMLELCRQGLVAEGFRVLRHAMFPPNDGGIALGQAFFGLDMLARGLKVAGGTDAALPKDRGQP